LRNGNVYLEWGPRWLRRGIAAALFVAILSGCGGAESVTTTVAAPATTTTAVATTTTTTADPLATGDVAGEALAAFRDWTSALYAGEFRQAWDLMAPSSQASLGSFELFESFGSEMTESWEAWSLVEDVSVAVDQDAAGRTRAVFSGVVEREGMTEEATTTVFVVLRDGSVVLSPFEEFGNVAVGLAGRDDVVPVPAQSGIGRRIVYSNSQQRVWLIGEAEDIVDTYLVSGREGVPDPGVYEVFSKSEIAYAGHDGITMRYMVRFTRAESGVAIGFHSIPNRASGEPLQTEEQLGEFHSAGCVRQSLGEAAALYEWAEEGTQVVVLA
jgi:hypothetical protein